MEKLKIEIEKAVRLIIKNYLETYFSKIIIEGDLLRARELYDDIDETLEFDIEDYLMDKACDGISFKENHEISASDKQDYERRFQEYKLEYERLKKQIIRPIHQDFKAKVKEMRQEYQNIQAKYIKYFSEKHKNTDETAQKSSKVFSILQKWRKSDPK